MSSQTMRGTPPPVMLPARNYNFSIEADKHYNIEIPRRGKYSDLAPDLFDEEAGEFEVLSSGNVLYMPAITKVLFAAAKYPDMENNQLFVPHTIEIKEHTVNVIGQIIELNQEAEEEGE